MTKRRYTMAAVLTVAIGIVVPAAVLPATSHAAAYRYWSYWLGSERGWAYANVGPAFRVPADGTVEGWRFSVSGAEGNHAPSFAADFDAVCGDTNAVDGRKRVAVIVDPGLTSHAPEGEQPPGSWAMCVVAEPRATGYDVLRSVATVRAERGLICGIGGYPARGCADVLAAPTPTKTPSPSAPASPDATRSPRPTPSKSATAAPVATPGTTASLPSTAPTPQGTAAMPATPTPVTVTPEPTSSATQQADAVASPTPEDPAGPAPEPTYSLLTSPLVEPPSGGGPGGALVAGIAVAGIAGLGGAAILRMRRGI